MKHSHWFLAIALVLLAKDCTMAYPSESRTSACDIAALDILAANQQDAQDVCAGARGAIDFLSAHGLELAEGSQIEVSTTLAGYASDTAAGCTVEEHRRAIILDYRRFAEFGTWFQIPIDRSLYKSLAAHEVAHLVAACNFKVERPTIEAREYIAYVTQIATMDPASRSRLLDAYPADGFTTDQQINTTIYLFDPMQFGVRAYRHYLRPENGRGFLRSVIAGERLSN